MSLDPTYQAEFNEWLHNHFDGGAPECPLCHHKDWRMGNPCVIPHQGERMMTEIKPEDVQRLPLGMSAMLICKLCSYQAFFAWKADR